MSRKVIIIGGGVAGLCVAYFCARDGHSVTVIERKPARRDGCSFGNAGMVVPSHFVPLAAPGMVGLALKWMRDPASPFYIRPRFDLDLLGWGLKFWQAATAERVRLAAPLLRDLALSSRRCFEEFDAQWGSSFGLVKKGLLMLCREQHALDEEAKAAAQARALGIPADVLDAKATAQLDPGARLNIIGSVYFPMDCHLEPERFMVSLQSRLESSGVQFLWDTEVIDWKTDNGNLLRAVVCSADRELRGDEFVLCGGSWSPGLAQRLGLKIPIQAGKGYSLTMPRPRQLPQICSILTEARCAITPMGKTLRVGGTMEMTGLNEDVNPVRVRGIINSFCRYFPDFTPADFEGIQPWRGLRPCSPDGLPFVGRVKRWANLSVLTGHAMLGVTLGPATGKLAAQIIRGERPEIDISLLSPDRYN